MFKHRITGWGLSYVYYTYIDLCIMCQWYMNTERVKMIALPFVLLSPCLYLLIYHATLRCINNDIVDIHLPKHNFFTKYIHVNTYIICFSASTYGCDFECRYRNWSLNCFNVCECVDTDIERYVYAHSIYSSFYLFALSLSVSMFSSPQICTNIHEVNLVTFSQQHEYIVVIWSEICLNRQHWSYVYWLYWFQIAFECVTANLSGRLTQQGVDYMFFICPKSKILFIF